MAIPKKLVKLVFERDQACWHCGTDDDTLVPHHRVSRGLGGSKLLDTPDNLILVCSRYNGEMESNQTVASAARGWGHKLSHWEPLDKPVFDCAGFAWYVLDSKGGKEQIDVREYF